MNDLGRMLPPGFAQAYFEAFGCPPPEGLLEAYELLCEALYFGAGAYDELQEKVTRRGWAGDYFFGDWTLLRVKRRADTAMAATTAALRAWTTARTRQSARRSRPREDRRAPVDRARVTGVGT